MASKSKFQIIILGNSAAIPTKTRKLSSQIVIINNEYFLVDCGEGTQMQLIIHGIKYQKINNIFISHLHGDHFFGLIGLISTYHLLGREKPLNIYAPPQLEKLIRIQLEVAHTILSYKLIFHYLESNHSTLIFENTAVSVFSFPMTHRVPTYGFRFQEKPKPRNIKKTFIDEYNPSIEAMKSIKSGCDYTDGAGKLIKNKDITISPSDPRSYAFCSDTRYDESIINYVMNANLIYHEATFDNSMQEKAYEKFHSTSGDAAKIAKKARVGSLLLGHFSARNEDLSIIKQEAEEVFKPVSISEEGEIYNVE